MCGIRDVFFYAHPLNYTGLIGESFVIMMPNVKGPSMQTIIGRTCTGCTLYFHLMFIQLFIVSLFLLFISLFLLILISSENCMEYKEY